MKAISILYVYIILLHNTMFDYMFLLLQTDFYRTAYRNAQSNLNCIPLFEY